MKKLTTTSLALMLMAFTGQSLSGELESKAGESSSQCSKYAGDWYLVQGNDKKDDFFFGKYTIKNDGTAIFDVFYGYSDFEQGTYASNIECKNGIIIDTAVGSQDVIKFQVKKHTASNLDLNILHEGEVAGVDNYTSSFKEPILGFELSKSNNILYRKALDKLNPPNEEFKKTEVINGRKIIHANNDNLRAIVKNEIQKQGTYIADLNHIDVSKVTYLTRLFNKSKFNGDISGWDVSNVTSMEGMFNGSKFNGNISEWDVSNVETMKRMFMKSKFSGDISEWDVSNVTDMKYMFVKSVFNRDISRWDVSGFSKLRESPNGYDKMIDMFLKAEFKGDISNWKTSNSTVWNIVHQEIKRLGTAANLNHIDISNVTNMSRMFRRSGFNGDISGWDVSNVRDMSLMFSDSEFNGDISKWDVSKVTNMEGMFEFSKFNGDISKWQLSSHRQMSQMFYGSSFKGDITGWPVELETLRAAIDLSHINYSKYLSGLEITNRNMAGVVKLEIKRLGNGGNLNHLDMSKVTNMRGLFRNSEFNGDISNWDVSNVTNMENMFKFSNFNGDVSGWDVSNVTDMGSMFDYSKFNRDISNWNVSNVTEKGYMFSKALNKKKEYQPKFKH